MPVDKRLSRHTLTVEIAGSNPAGHAKRDRKSGRRAVWRSRLLREQEHAGSTPVAQTKTYSSVGKGTLGSKTELYFMDKTLLEKMITQGFSHREIAQATDRSPTSIRYWLDKHGLKTKCAPFNKGSRKKWKCSKCGEADPSRFYARKNRCKTCHGKETLKRGHDIRKKAILHKGGKCEICGYDKNMAALEFHHTDPSKKDPKWHGSRSWKWDRLKAEIDECMLACKNCHAETHHPQFDSWKEDP